MIPDDGQLEFSLRIDPFSPPTAFVVQYNDGKTRRIVWGDKSTVGFDNVNADMGPIPAAGNWIDVSVPFETAGTKAGARITSLVLIENGGKVWFDDMRITGRSDRAQDPLSSFQRWWELCKGTNPSGIDGELRTLLVGGPNDSVTAEHRDQLLRFWQQHVQRIAESPVAELRIADCIRCSQ